MKSVTVMTVLLSIAESSPLFWSVFRTASLFSFSSHVHETASQFSFLPACSVCKDVFYPLLTGVKLFINCTEIIFLGL